MDVTCFFTWGRVDDTFTRRNFHEMFKTKIALFLNAWLLPRSVVVHDIAKIHMYEELQALISATGALRFSLPQSGYESY
ncbi:Transposase [Phytophthora megakarya]|uniref:Transposase n=1 Tax=Phytophthora megakarya TaxID=4795 RepID=A0A225VDX0_9STRA|nr:Transposase [Phytophthora megakarya]